MPERVAAFRRGATEDPAPPQGLAGPLLALWWDARGDWTRVAVRFDLAAAGRLPRALYLFTIGHGTLQETVVADALRVRQP